MIQAESENIGIFIEYKDYVLWFLGFLVTYLFFKLNNRNNEIKEIKNKLSDKKYNLYNNVFSILFDAIKNKGNKVTDEIKDDTVDKLIEIKKDMFIYASDNVLNKFLEWNNRIGKEEDVLLNMPIYFELLVLIRKDMGNSKTKVNQDTIIRAILSSDDEFSKFKTQSK